MEPVLVHTTDSDDKKFAAFKIESKKWRWIASFFASHPSLDDRIKALEELRV
jgi:Zn-dependent protease with chaperone function